MTAALVIFGVAAIVSFFLDGDAPDDAIRDQSDLSEGYYLEGASLIGTDAMGAIEYSLRAERVDHNPRDGSISLANLTLDYGGRDSAWVMRARTGRMPRESTEITLSGDVQIENTPGGDAAVTRISSENLRIDIEGKSASTAEEVRITMGRGSVRGMGLQVDLANEKVEILSDVTGVFDPPPQ